MYLSVYVPGTGMPLARWVSKLGCDKLWSFSSRGWRKSSARFFGVLTLGPTDMDEFEKIGDDEILHVFKFLCHFSLTTASQVCFRWRCLAQTELLWKGLCFEDKQLAFKPDHLSWKDVYRTDTSDICPHLKDVNDQGLLWLGEHLKVRNWFCRAYPQCLSGNRELRCSGEDTPCSFELDYLWFCMSVGNVNFGLCLCLEVALTEVVVEETMLTH